MKKYVEKFILRPAVHIKNSDVKINDIDKIFLKVLCLIERTITVLVVSLYSVYSYKGKIQKLVLSKY